MDKELIQKLKAELDELSFNVIVHKGTEAPFSGHFDQFNDDGQYLCKACGHVLFTSKHKFYAGCGWPSFDQALSTNAIKRKDDLSHGMSRVEVVCANCEAHLGHVFNDGPTDTGERFCINSVSMSFKPAHDLGHQS